VTAEAPMLETRDGDRASTVENRVLEAISDQWAQSLFAGVGLPGVVKANQILGSMELYAYTDINCHHHHGGRIGENETLIDGLSNPRLIAAYPCSRAQRNAGVLRQSNIYDAQYGRFGGGVTRHRQIRDPTRYNARCTNSQEHPARFHGVGPE